MGLIVGAILAFTFLDPPWRYLALIPLALWEAFELSLLIRWRRVRARMGPETLIGARGRAMTECRPNGEVRLRGQIWKAHCSEGVDKGEDVEVVSQRGLVLEVSPLRP